MFKRLGICLIVLILGILLYDSGMRERKAVQEVEALNSLKMDSGGAGLLIRGFRGLAADAVFLKCVNLQDEKRYEDIPVLAGWLISLQPDFKEAVTYWASNLAWNISAVHGDYELRWQWVRHGIELLKDKAIPAYNAPEYHLEMARIYFMRIGEIIERADVVFKTKLLVLMSGILGKWDMTNLASAASDVYDMNEVLGDGRFEMIMEAHSTDEEALYNVFKEFRRIDLSDVSEFEKEVIELYLRRRLLFDETGIDAVVAADVNEIYGELDWRLADSLAVYWAHTGRERALELEVNPYRYESMLMRALLRVLQNGTLFYLNEGYELQTSPNFEVVDYLDGLFPVMLRQYKRSEKAIKNNHRNFLLAAISLFYAYGEESRAKDYFIRFRQFFPEEAKSYSLNELALSGLSGAGSSHDYRSVQTLISGLYRRMFEYLGTGEPEKARALEQTAAKAWKSYKLNVDVADYEKGKLPPLRSIRSSVYESLKGDLPQSLIERIKKMK